MKKNYLSKTAMSANPLAMIVAKKSWKNMTTAWLLLLFTVFGFTDALQAQIAQRGAATTATSTGTTITINRPTGVVAGDIMLVNISSRDTGGNNLSNPTSGGWTLVQGSQITQARRWGAVMYKIATGSEPADYTFTLDTDANATVGAIVAFSGVDTTTPFDVASPAYNTANANTVTAIGLTTVTPNAAVIMFGVASNNPTWSGWTTTTPGVLTELYDVAQGTNVTAGAAWALKPTAGATWNGTATISSMERNGAILVALRPSIPPTITSLSATSGCVGSTLTINGTNLLGATAVTIGLTPATITGTTATSVTVTIGTGTTGTVQVTTSGGTATSAATFTVNPLPTITLTSAGGTNNQTRCINTAITTITYTVAGGGATGATVTGLPAGVTGSFAAGVVTISGTPSVSGTFNYTVTTTGGSCSTTSNGTITVRALPTIALTSAAATANQSICRGSAITNIVYTIGGGATGVTTAGLPAGVTGNLVGSTYTLSGTPTANGTFNYTLTTSGGAPCANATINGTLVVNALPANPGNPTSNSPQCNPPGVTLTRTGTPPAGETWYWQTGAGGTSTANSGATFVATTGGTYYLRAQNNTTGCWSAGSGSVAITITPSLSAVAGTPAPTNAATGICYAGAGAVTSISWGAVAGATSYDVYFGAGSVPATVTANVATNTYNTGALSANTTYYWRIVAKNACGDAPTSATFSFTTATSTCVCIPTATTDDDTGITNVTFNTINNSTSGTAAYTDYTSISTSVMGTSTYPLSVRVNTAGNFTVNVRVWIDWNANGTFEAGEQYNLGSATNVTDGATSASPFNILVPNTPGTYQMRIRAVYNAVPTACGNQNYSETEDYTINVYSPTPCVAPTAQPTALALTPSGNFISGSFAPAVPTANGYLVVMNTTNVAPTPVNGTNYVIGNTIGAGNTVVGVGSGTTFFASGLTPTTTYYFFVYSFNNLCVGGPLYNTSSPLNGTSTTTTADPVYCSPSPSVGVGYESLTYFTNISFVGTLNDVSNNSTYSSAPRGYQDFTTLPNIARQAQGQGVNISTQTTNRGYMKAWVDWNKDGDFLDAGEKVYDVGGIASYSTTFGFVIPALQAVGNYRIRIRISKDDSSNACINWGFCDPSAISTFDACQNINYYGETEDYIFTVVASCSAVITAVTDGGNCGPGNVVLGATGSGAPTQYRWYTTEFGGTPVATTATGSWTTPLLAATTTYWVTAFNGCESLVRTKVVATINPLANLTFTPSVPEVCGENNVLSLTASGDKQLSYLVNEPFNSGLGVMINDNIVSNGGVTDGITQWQNRPSTFVPAQQVWFPAIASGLNGNNFAMATSDVGSVITHNAIMSPVINSTNYLNLTMSFDIYYSRYYVDGTSLALDYVTVDVSTDGGVAWTELTRYTADIGYGTRFVNKTFNLNGHINQSNLRVRVRYYGQWCDGLAIDNFKVYGDVPLNTSFDWTSVTPVAAFQDFACTTPYATGTPITTVFIRPTLTQLEQGTYNFTATATLSNGCSVSQNISIQNKSKVWKGGSSNDWNNPNNWSPVGVPDATTCVIIPPAANTSNVLGTNYNGFGKTLQVVNGGNLTIHPSNTLTITDFVEVRGATSIFNIENTGSLIQVNNVANSGIISMKRNATIKALDYVYWSSPVASFASNAISPATPTSVIWKWEPTTATPYLNQFGNWVNGNETMTIGRGYIVRSPNGWPTANTTFTANFVGVPNNGTILRPITRWTYTGGPTTGPTSTPVTANDDNWNLLGNPYPSAISADAFLTANLTHINPFVDLWKHGNAPAAIASPFYQNYQLNYNPNDYLRYNHLGPTLPGFDGKIGAGQGFFVLMRDAGGTTENAIFNNSMRSNTHRNDQFFRTTESNVTTTDFERHRIWLMMVAPNLVSSDILVGYATGAQNNFDEEFDAMNRGVKVNYELYSLADAKGLSIQGRALPFDTNDQIPLGVKIAQNGIHTIAISAADGLFGTTTQDIYLEDRTLGITHDLRTVPYSFTATPGTYENRFVLKFNNQTLGIDDFTANAVTVYTDDNLNVTATNQTIKSVRVHDLLGKVIGTFNNVNAGTFSTRNIAKTQSPLLVEVTLENGATKTYKVIF